MFLLFSGLTSIGRSDDTVGGRAEKASQNGERDLTTLTMLFHQIPVSVFYCPYIEITMMPIQVAKKLQGLQGISLPDLF